MRTSLKKFLHLFKPGSLKYSESSSPIQDMQYPDDQLQIEITHKESDKHDNVTEFWFRPSRPIKLQKILINIDNDEDVIDSDQTIDYGENNWYLLAGYEDVQTGDNWKFTFTYSLDGQETNSTSSIQYTI